MLRQDRRRLGRVQGSIRIEFPGGAVVLVDGSADPALVCTIVKSLRAERQSDLYAREGVDLHRSTLAGWVGASAALLAPLVESVRSHVLSATRLHADDTPVPVLAPGNGRTKTGRLWTYVRDGRPAGDPAPPAVWFAFSPDRRGEHPQGHLKSFRGTLQADAYAGFHPLYEGGRIVEAACWAHTRRKFHDLFAVTQSPTAAETIRRVGELFAVEKQVRGSPPEIRLVARQTRSRPIMEELKRWLDQTLETVSTKSDMAGAIRYALARWDALTRFLDDGTVEIDNNAAERALRIVALGRRNYLFAGSNRGGERAAAIYSLLGTARLNGTNPEHYLRHVLTHIADHPIQRITELLPWNMTATLTPERTTDAYKCPPQISGHLTRPPHISRMLARCEDHTLTVEHYSRHFHRSPDQLGLEHIRQYQAAMFRTWKLAPNTVAQRLAALRFLYIQVAGAPLRRLTRRRCCTFWRSSFSRKSHV